MLAKWCSRYWDFQYFPVRYFFPLPIPGGAIAPLVRAHWVLLGPYPPPPLYLPLICTVKTYINIVIVVSTSILLQSCNHSYSCDVSYCYCRVAETLFFFGHMECVLCSLQVTALFLCRAERGDWEGGCVASYYADLQKKYIVSSRGFCCYLDIGFLLLYPKMFKQMSKLENNDLIWLLCGFVPLWSSVIFLFLNIFKNLADKENMLKW